MRKPHLSFVVIVGVFSLLLLMANTGHVVLVGYWNFNENSGTTAYDTSVYGNDGQITEAAWIPGRCGSALDFDGGSDGNIDYVTIPDTGSTSIDVTTFTISFWLKLSNANKHQVFINKRNGYHHINYWFSYYLNDTPPGQPTGNYLMAGIAWGSGSLPSTYDGGPYYRVTLNADQWYYISATYNGATGLFILYLDGSEVARTTRIALGDITGDGDLHIGAEPNQPAYGAAGIMDEVRIYNHVLTESEIVADMDACPPVADAGIDRVVFDVITFDGSGSYDDGTIVSYDWTLLHRSNSAHNRSATGVNPTVTNLANGLYDVRLDVTDDDGLVGTDSMLLGAAGSCDVCTPQTIHVESILAKTAPGIKGEKYCEAVVTIFDNCGTAISGVTVTGSFTEANVPDEVGSGDTDANGRVVVTHSTPVTKPSYKFCVDNVTGGALPYNSNENIEDCETK